METIGTPGLLSRDARPGLVGTIAIVAGALIGGVALADWGLRGWHFWNGPAVLLAIALIGVPIQQAGRRALDRRIASVLEPWAAARGLVFQAAAGNPRTTPTLDEGGLLGPALVGPIGGDPVGFLAHYTYSVGSGDNRRLVRMSVAVVRFEGREGLRLRLGPASALAGDAFGVFDDWRAFETGSVEVDTAYTIEARDGHDPVQLMELLEPVALVALIDESMPPLVEIDNGTLLVAYGGRVGIDQGVEDLMWFERLRAHADAWGERIRAI